MVETKGEAAVEHQATHGGLALGVASHTENYPMCPGAGHRCNSSQTSSMLMVTREIKQQGTYPPIAPLKWWW
jgi:hypothetical protein